MNTQIEILYERFLASTGVSIDTRAEVQGSLFFALSGERFNGNEFAKTALSKGASFAIIDEVEFQQDDRYLLVPDTLKALQQLAAHHRRITGPIVFAITGSNGKTTTKELIASVLRTEKQIVATTGNLNNHIGVPLTLLKIKPETEIAVVEMGANHRGEIAELCLIAQPDSGMITNIGKAHLEGFGSFEGVILAKNELFAYLRNTQKKVIVNADDQLLMKLSEGMDRITFGSRAGTIRGQLLSAHPHITFAWQDGGDTRNCHTHLYGSYNFNNLMAAIAVGKFFSISPDNIHRATANFIPRNNRSQQLKTKANEIILDAYNANPVSMREAIKSFVAFQPENPFLILGDMFELGKESPKEHKKILQQVERTGFQDIIFIGKDFFKLTAESRFLFFETMEQAEEHLKNTPIRNAHVLVKGSRGMHLENLLKYL